MRRIAAASLALAILSGWLVWRNYSSGEAIEQTHYDRGETELIVSNPSHTSLTLYEAGSSLKARTVVAQTFQERAWLRPGNYYLSDGGTTATFYIPVPLTGYRGGPDKNGAFLTSIRPSPGALPPVSTSDSGFIYIPGGNFLLGDRLNPKETHYVWLTGFFVSPFELSNGEFRKFLNDPAGYADAKNWSEQGKIWKSEHRSQATALLHSDDPQYARFGQDDQPITWVNWFEANAYCRWLTVKFGKGEWLFSLPTDAEWEKAARGPENFDYALGMSISDSEVRLYNWRKNPDAPVTVIGNHQTPLLYLANRYGLYHMTGNVAEWSQSVNVPWNRENPYVEDERNHDDTPGLRSVRGGSWYSAAISYLYIPYRDAFQPEHSSQELGFRIVAKALP